AWLLMAACTVHCARADHGARADELQPTPAATAAVAPAATAAVAPAPTPAPSTAESSRAPAPPTAEPGRAPAPRQPPSPIVVPQDARVELQKEVAKVAPQ